ncbi:hypothetical protein GCM10009676_09690 [Prauserella halophila]|uniref:DUF2867 domain-containing protein n=1 Tax=Prauserella halophila TaxID=185641 RepID=A0ABN1W061_9PSEU|nr:hypothetical protein [Prauserella halophila]MCP2235324.1 hypothetical protein [Prauserella halophila]
MTYRLEQLLPDHDRREYHETRVPGPPEIAWAALTDLRVRDLPLSTLLSRLRGGPKAWFAPFDGGDGRALDNVPPRELCADPPRELILGDIADYTGSGPTRPDVPRGDLESFLRFDEPGWTKVAMNFRFAADGRETRLSTETRVLATDEGARKAFAKYWLLVRAGSGLIRRDILSAVRSAAAERTRPGI